MNIHNIYKQARPKNCSKERKISDTYVIQNFIVKKITPLAAYCLKGTSISADLITIISYFTIVLSSFFFLISDGLLGIIFLVLFGFLDSLDGDIARIKKSKSYHGQTMDIYGADLFYFLIPFSISYFIFKKNIENIYFNEEFIILVGFLISFLMIFKRLNGLRNYVLFLNKKNFEKNKKKFKKKNSVIKQIVNFYEHPIITGNFFSEPGFILNFSILIFFNFFQFLYYYLIIIFVYHLIGSTILFVGTILFFIRKNN